MTVRKYLDFRTSVGQYLLKKRISRASIALYMINGWISTKISRYLKEEPVATFQRIRSIWDPRWQAIKTILVMSYGPNSELWPKDSKGYIILNERKILEHNLEFRKYGMSYIRRIYCVTNQSDRLLQ